MKTTSNKFMDKESEFSGKYAKTVLDTILQAYGSFKYKIILAVVVGFLGRILLLANANILGHWLDHNFIPFSDLSLILVTITLVGFIFTLLFRITFARLSAKAISQVYDEVTFRTSRYPIAFFDQTPTGRIITRFSSDYGNVFRLFGGPLAEFFAIIFDLIAMLILIGIASPYFLPIVAFVGLLNYLVFRNNKENIRKARRDLSYKRSPSIAHFSETAQGATTIRTFNKERSFLNRFHHLDSEYLNQKRTTFKELMLFSFKMNSLTALLLLFTGGFSYYVLEQGLVSIGSIGVAFGFIALSGSTVQMFFEWMAQFEEAMVGMERLDDYIRKPLESGAKLPHYSKFATGHAKYSEKQEDHLQTQTMTSLPQARVSFRNVWFRYKEDLPFALKDIDFDIKAGERFGIIGRTGSGKSSLIQALFYLYPLAEGKVEVAGYSPQFENPAASTVDLKIYRKSMSYISQDPILFKGDLRMNLDIENSFSDEVLCNVLSKVGLRQFAKSQTLTMAIEERGRNLSLGEKQLICMARCLLQNAPVVIMDEATSSIDPQSEELLVKATNEFFKGRTQIIIAHRLSTLESCDRVLWLDNGRIKMIGPAKEILPSFRDQ